MKKSTQTPTASKQETPIISTTIRLWALEIPVTKPWPAVDAAMTNNIVSK